MVAERRIVKASIVNTGSTVNKKTYRAVRDTRRPREPSLIAEEHIPECFTDTRQLAPLQVQSSKFPGGMREEQRTAYIVNKINEGKATNYLPESSTVLTPSILPIPIPTAPPSETAHQLEYASKVTALQHSHNVSGEE